MEAVLVNLKILNAVSLGADAASALIDITSVDNASIHIKCGAGATGQFYIQGSNVPAPSASDWQSIPVVDEAGAAVALTVTGSATDWLANLQGLSFSYLRVIYARTSGTGTANAWLTAKNT